MRSGVHCPALSISGTPSGNGPGSIFMVMSEISTRAGTDFAPEVDLGIAVRLNEQDRHALSRPHGCRVEEKFLVERKRFGRNAYSTYEQW